MNSIKEEKEEEEVKFDEEKKKKNDILAYLGSMHLELTALYHCTFKMKGWGGWGGGGQMINQMGMETRKKKEKVRAR